VTFPLYSAYHSTKWAVEGFTESLQYELAPLGIRTILVEPAPIRTDFYQRSAEKPSLGIESAYRNYFDRLMNTYDRIGRSAVGPEVVARVVVRAASSRNPRLRYVVGGSAPVLLLLRRFLPDRAFAGIVRLSLGA
jgi:NAD(P)-dependent dehydrogenase (short-subunit alcohol dehydrogenase family)